MALCKKLEELSFLKLNFHVDIFGNFNPHNPSEGPFVRIDINQPFVYAHLPMLVGFGASPTGALPNRNRKFFGWKGYFSGMPDAGSFGKVYYLVADFLNLAIILA